MDRAKMLRNEQANLERLLANRNSRTGIQHEEAEAKIGRAQQRIAALRAELAAATT